VVLCGCGVRGLILGAGFSGTVLRMFGNASMVGQSAFDPSVRPNLERDDDDERRVFLVCSMKCPDLATASYS
jgi:hypothetical protein